MPGPGDTARQPALWNGFGNMASLAGHAVTIARGEGAWVFDTDGRAYLDALASLWYCNVVHGRGELADAAAAQMRQLAAYQVFEPFTNPSAEELARRVADLAPVPGAKVSTRESGSAASSSPASTPRSTAWLHASVIATHTEFGANVHSRLAPRSWNSSWPLR